MSHASKIRRVRKLRRGIGEQRMTRKQQLDGIAAKVMREIIKSVGTENVRFVQDTAFSLTIETASPEVDRILQQHGYFCTCGGEYVHKKMRLSDFAGIGAVVSLVPNTSADRSLGQLPDWNLDLGAALPEVSEEEVSRVGKLLSSTEAVRLDDIR
jgi:hypothetical protein